jgi:O-antigen/teichoic acid export membrane protein
VPRESRLSGRAFWGLASWALPLALVFFITPPLVRELGPPRFGILMTVLVAPLLASQFDFGIAASSVRRIASMLPTGQVDAGRTLATLAVALGCLGVALGVSVWLLADLLARWLGFEDVLGHAEAVSLVRLCAVWLAVALLTTMPGILARAAQAMTWITLAQTATTAVVWLVALAAARSGRSLSDVVVAGIVMNLGTALATALAMRRHVRWRTPFCLDVSLLRSEARFSAGMFISQAAGAIVYQGDRILISAVGSPAIAGAYALCANIANKTLAGVAALTSFALPHASGLTVRGDRAQMASFLHALDRGVIVLVAPILLPGVLLSEPFLTLWLRDQSTRELVSVFRILWVAFALNAFSVPVGSILAAHGSTGLAARFAWLTVLIVIGSILLLVPSWGAPGAAVAMLLGMATSPVFNLVARRTLALPAPVGRLRFWSGMALGVAAQVIVLSLWHGSVSSWLLFVAAGTSAVATFYVVRAIFGRLSPEEARVLEALALRLRRNVLP